MANRRKPKILTKVPRLLLVDFLRFLSFVAIAIHHYAWIFFYTKDVPPIIAGTTYTGIMQLVTESYARSLSFSGFTIVGLAAFFQAFTQQTFKKRFFLFSFLLLGWVVFCILVALETGFYPGWDVYPLLFTGLITCTIAEKISSKFVKLLGVVGHLLLLIPFWNFSHFFDIPFFLKQALIGVCENDLADWPILPWIGLIWLSYWAGWEINRVIRGENSASETVRPESILDITKGESFVWVGLLIASLPQLGAYYHVPLGPEFPCFVYRQNPYVFWSSYIWVVFIVRIAFDSRVRTKIDGIRFFKVISNLAMTRHFWLAYIIHYCLAYAINYVLDAMGGEQNWWYIHAIGITYPTYLIMVEFLTRWTLQLVKSPYLRNWSRPRKLPT